jgi:hypothetical protein
MRNPPNSVFDLIDIVRKWAYVWILCITVTPNSVFDLIDIVLRTHSYHSTMRNPPNSVFDLIDIVLRTHSYHSTMRNLHSQLQQ